MIDWHDVMVAGMAAAGAYAGVRVEIRHLWRQLRDALARINRLESLQLKKGN